MGFDGLNEFENKLKSMQKAAEELNGTHDVPLSDLLTEPFMRQFTSFSSFEELLKAGGFILEDDLDNILGAEFDQHIKNTTNFDNWQDMLDEAVSEYVSKKLGF